MLKIPSKQERRKKKSKASSESKIKSTRITADINIGWGNHLFIRGDSPGLSWESGVEMECLNFHEWEWSSSEIDKTFDIKFLINDEIWSSGDNFTIKSGVTTRIIPEFF